MKIRTMKLLTFLLFAICVSGLYNLRTLNDSQAEELINLKQELVLKNDTIQLKTKSLRIYAPLAIHCNANHKD